MGALTIAFDITIVGALALPWVILIIHLFFSEGEYRLPDLMKWVGDQKQPAVAAVLLFAVTYTMGSAVSRIAFDFFDDNDIHLQIDDHWLRIAITEDRLHTSVYCDYKDKDAKWDKDEYDNSYLLQAKTGDEKVAAAIRALKAEESYCWQNLKWWVRVSYGVDDGRLNKAAQDLFGLQENQLYLKGEDATLRLRQLHDQIMVLRGAAFNGMLAFSLCLFAWGAKFRRERPNSRLRFAFAPAPLAYIFLTFLATYHHLQERVIADPPYMEFTLILLSLAGAWLVWWPPPPQARPLPEPPGVVAEHRRTHWQKERWGLLTALSGILMLAAAMGWWSTETFYSEQVVYSYNAHAAQK